MYTHTHIYTLSVRWILDKIAPPEQTVKSDGYPKCTPDVMRGFSCIEREDTRVTIRIPLVACRLNLVVIRICTEESVHFN